MHLWSCTVRQPHSTSPWRIAAEAAPPAVDVLFMFQHAASASRAAAGAWAWASSHGSWGCWAASGSPRAEDKEADRFVCHPESPCNILCPAAAAQHDSTANKPCAAFPPTISKGLDKTLGSLGPQRQPLQQCSFQCIRRFLQLSSLRVSSRPQTAVEWVALSIVWLVRVTFASEALVGLKRAEKALPV